MPGGINPVPGRRPETGLLKDHCGKRLFVTMVLRMVLGGMLCMILRVHMMPMGCMSMMRGFVVFARFIMLRGLMMMFGRFFMMFRCMFVMICMFF